MDTPDFQARKELIGTPIITNPVEVSFDRVGQRRVGRATLNTNLGEEMFFFTVEWQDRVKRVFSVRLYDHQP
jgi:hypothetical protein